MILMGVGMGMFMILSVPIRMGMIVPSVMMRWVMMGMASL